MKHMGWKVLIKRKSGRYDRLANTGKFITRSGAEEFVFMYKKLHPATDLIVVQHIVGK